MKEKVTLTGIALKRAIKFANDSGISEVFLYESGGKHYVTNPAPSISLDDESHPMYDTFPGVYIKLRTLESLFINIQTGHRTTVSLEQNGDSVLIRYS